MNVIFGGDFHQTCPIIRRATKFQIIQSTLIRSLYRNKLIIHKLTQNMRLQINELDTDEYKQKLRAFVEFQKNIAKGTATT